MQLIAISVAIQLIILIVSIVLVVGHFVGALAVLLIIVVARIVV